MFWGSSALSGAQIYHTEIEGYDELVGLDLTTPGASCSVIRC